ncbi:protein phosphatase 2C domain-containing protein [Kitasatospora azatica]|uniref:protein phosphatase 2C domain-containing protein n=1 Tax=Kitasatospora azatica TaxID=58347 RepID=UPI00056BD0A2|nr:protein phosphatase 2C domain-containing protein [Kitasatospora azatica]
MSNQGAPVQGRPEDGWWGRVYQGPAGGLPDTPDAEAGEGSVDDWFDSIASVVGLIGRQRSGEEEDAPGPEAVAPEPEPAAVVAPEPAAAPEPAPEPEPEPGPLTPVSLTKPDRPATSALESAAPASASAPHIGSRPPTYGPEPTAVPAAHPERVAVVVPDTVLDGAQYPGFTLRAASIRGDSARYRGEPRGDALLVTRFGEAPDGLLLAVLGSRARPVADPRAETDPQGPLPDTVRRAAEQLAEAIGRSRAELAADLREGARDRLRYGLQRLTARAAAGLRASTPEAGSLHCLLVSLDPAATHRAAFGLGTGGLYLLRAGHWIDAYAARLLHHPDGPISVPEPRPFRFRLVPTTPGDILLLCSPGLAEPIAEEPAVAHFLATHWSHPHPPGSVDFLRQVQVRAKGFADDRTAAALWTD